MPKWLATLLTSIFLMLLALVHWVEEAGGEGGDFLGMRTFTPLAMMAATSFCQTSTESQEILPGPAMAADVVEMDVVWVWFDAQVAVGRFESDQVDSGVPQSMSSSERGQEQDMGARCGSRVKVVK